MSRQGSRDKKRRGSMAVKPRRAMEEQVSAGGGYLTTTPSKRAAAAFGLILGTGLVVLAVVASLRSLMCGERVGAAILSRTRIVRNKDHSLA